MLVSQDPTLRVVEAAMLFRQFRLQIGVDMKIKLQGVIIEDLCDAVEQWLEYKRMVDNDPK